MTELPLASSGEKLWIPSDILLLGSANFRVPYSDSTCDSQPSSLQTLYLITGSLDDEANLFRYPTLRTRPNAFTDYRMRTNTFDPYTQPAVARPGDGVY